MKKLIATIVLSLAAVAAMAMPRPSDIENALAAHDYQSAKSMTQEVLRERPDSAKAHLFNAYVLLKADNDRNGAAAELRTARMLDKNHNVQDSALFGRTAAELERAAPVRAYAPQATYVEPTGDSGLVKFFRFLLWGSVIGVLAYILYKLFWRPKTTCVGTHIDYSMPGGGSPDVPARTASQIGLTPSAAAWPGHAAPVYSPTPVVVNNNGGSGSTVNGMMAGMMMGEMMHHHHSDGYGRDRIIERDTTYVDRSSAPSTTSSSSDYETSRSSYSSGRDDSWSSSSSSSSSSDSWGSSSSSSSYDSGSSWDSGSSSSSWD